MIDRRFHRVVAAVAWSGFLMLFSLAPAAAGRQFGELNDPKAKHLAFQASIAPSDPFSELNEPDRLKGKTLEVHRGDSFMLIISGKPDAGWHTYPLTRRAPGQIKEQLSSLTIDGGANFQPIYPVRESQPEWKDDRKDRSAVDEKALEDVTLEHDRPFTWMMEVYIKPTAPADQVVALPIKIRAQVCNKDCRVEDHAWTIPVKIASGPPLAPSVSLKKRLAVKEPEPEVAALPKSLMIARAAPKSGTGGTSSSTGPGSSTASSGMLGSIFQAIIGGFVALLTPCVFPMIPITISFFLKQSERRKAPALALAGVGGSTESVPVEEKSQGYPPVLLAAVYSGTIVLILSAGGLLLLGVLQQIIAHYITNFILSAVFLFFALSLLGMYDITLPSWLQDKTAARENRGGLVGVVFMAITFSIVSFACVGPIYGGFLTLGASDQSVVAHYWHAVPMVLGFSVAFASPFFLLALFPSMLKSMPRAGSWMNSVKVVIGFLELAAGVGFLRTGELVLTKTSTFFTFDLCLGIYVAISFACGLYLLGVYRLPHDHEAPESIGVPRLMFALCFLTLGLYLTPGLFKGSDGDAQRPRGKVFAWVEAFLLPEMNSSAARSSAPGSSEKLVWHHKLNEALAEAKRDNKLVFLDITGIACKNCRLNERDKFPRPEVQAALSKHVLVTLYAEAGVPNGIDQQPGSDETIQLRDAVFKTRALPVYALLKPTDDGKFGFEIVRRINDEGNGLIEDIPAFVKALEK